MAKVLEGGKAFDMYIALSPQGSGDIFPDNAWADIRSAVLMMTGTEDNDLNGRSWKTRTEPYLNMPDGCKWLGVIDGAKHMHFASNGASRRSEALIIQTIGDFARNACKPPIPRKGMLLQTK